jgi:hypothetical protein
MVQRGPKIGVELCDGLDGIHHAERQDGDLRDELAGVAERPHRDIQVAGERERQHEEEDQVTGHDGGTFRAARAGRSGNRARIVARSSSVRAIKGTHRPQV